MKQKKTNKQHKQDKFPPILLGTLAIIFYQHFCKGANSGRQRCC